MKAIARVVTCSALLLFAEAVRSQEAPSPAPKAEEATPAEGAEKTTELTPAQRSVRERLGARAIEAKLDEDGDFAVTFEYDEDKRTQLVFVSGKTEEIRGFLIREIFAPAARLKGGMSRELALELLRDSSTLKLGAWELAGDTLFFVAKVSDTLTAQELATVMDVVAYTADQRERELSGDADEL